jgi:methyl-accepting chemotaxis protein
MKLSNLKIGTKLGGAFLAVICLTVGVGGFAIAQLAKINANTKDLAMNWLPSIRVLGDLQLALNTIRRSENDLALCAGCEDAAAIEKKISERRQTLQDVQGRYEPMITSGAEKQGYEQFQRHLDAFFATHNRLALLTRGGEKSLPETRNYLWGDSRSAFEATIADAAQLLKINDEGAAAAYQSAEATFSRVRTWVIAMLGFTIIIAATLAYWITRLITAPVSQALGAATRIADGDLTVQLTAIGSDEPAQLVRALSLMKDNLANIVRGVRDSADNVATASSQIAQGNLDLSGRTEQQAGSLEETAATMEELSTTVRNNSDRAEEANKLATSASGVAAKGGEVVSQVVDTMKEINESSKKIADIISVIDGIAFQTNLLALNAAVEAARAGEQGRGFAVVATEVRNLAGRSAQAAKEIKALITGSVQQIEQGSALVDRAGETMEEIVSAIKRVNIIVGEISTASVEQSTGVSQVGHAVSQMDQATQQNAALVEQSAAAAESLNQLAQHLVQAVSVFKLTTIESRTPAPAASSPTHASVAQRSASRAAIVTKLKSGRTSSAPANSTIRSPGDEPARLAVGGEDWKEF